MYHRHVDDISSVSPQLQRTRVEGFSKTYGIKSNVNIGALDAFRIKSQPRSGEAFWADKFVVWQYPDAVVVCPILADSAIVTGWHVDLHYVNCAFSHFICIQGQCLFRRF